MAVQVNHNCDWKGCISVKARAITIFKQKTSTQPYHNYGSPLLCGKHRFAFITWMMENIDYKFKRGEPRK